MKNPAIAIATMLMFVGGIIACPSVSYHNKAVIVTPTVVAVAEPVYPSVAATTVTVHVSVAEYAAFLAPAVVVPYVAPPLPPPVVVPQIPLVPAAVPAAPVCPPATMPAAVAPAVSEDFCAKVLAELHSMKADIATLKQGQALPPVNMPPAVPEAANLPAARPSAALTVCMSCHSKGKEVKDAPALFDAAGISLMNDQAIRKATRLVKNGKMPPPSSDAAKAFTADAGNAALDALDDLPGAGGVVEKKVVPMP